MNLYEGGLYVFDSGKDSGSRPFFFEPVICVYTCIFICWEGGQCQLFDISFINLNQI